MDPAPPTLKKEAIERELAQTRKLLELKRREKTLAKRIKIHIIAHPEDAMGSGGELDRMNAELESLGEKMQGTERKEKVGREYVSPILVSWDSQKQELELREDIEMLAREDWDKKTVDELLSTKAKIIEIILGDRTLGKSEADFLREILIQELYPLIREKKGAKIDERLKEEGEERKDRLREISDEMVELTRKRGEQRELLEKVQSETEKNEAGTKLAAIEKKREQLKKERAVLRGERWDEANEQIKTLARQRKEIDGEIEKIRRGKESKENRKRMWELQQERAKINLQIKALKSDEGTQEIDHAPAPTAQLEKTRLLEEEYNNLRAELGVMNIPLGSWVTQSISGLRAAREVLEKYLARNPGIDELEEYIKELDAELEKKEQELTQLEEEDREDEEALQEIDRALEVIRATLAKRGTVPPRTTY
ncbi:MAG: hypothetical protein Q8O46_01370 [bacterium]|nr:hypothetical protein [bacterium]